jgi:hypothetical protein
MEKNGKDNKNAKKVGQTISLVPTPKPKHDKIRTQWVSNISFKSMLEMYDGANAPRWIHAFENFVAQ